MAVVQARIAPFIRENFVITGTQYYYSGSGEPHGGLDIATYATSLHILYSMVNGKVLSVVENHKSYGKYIIIQDLTTGDTFLYAHMARIDVFTNQLISMGDQVGIEGSTGNVTGRHVHLELQFLNPGDSWVWGVPYNDRPNVAEYMGLTNTQGLVGYYDGTPHPIPTVIKRRGFPFVLFAKKSRQKRNIIT